MAQFREASDGDAPDLKLAVAIASGKSQRQAAKVAGVSVRTVARKVEDPRFRRLVAGLRAAGLDTVLTQMSAALGGLSAGLVRLAKKGKDDHVRLRATIAVFDLVLKYRGQVEFEDRLRKLEEGALYVPPESPPAGEAGSQGETGPPLNDGVHDAGSGI